MGVTRTSDIVNASWDGNPEGVEMPDPGSYPADTVNGPVRIGRKRYDGTQLVLVDTDGAEWVTDPDGYVLVPYVTDTAVAEPLSAIDRFHESLKKLPPVTSEEDPDAEAGFPSKIEGTVSDEDGLTE